MKINLISKNIFNIPGGIQYPWWYSISLVVFRLKEVQDQLRAGSSRIQELDSGAQESNIKLGKVKQELSDTAQRLKDAKQELEDVTRKLEQKIQKFKKVKSR